MFLFSHIQATPMPCLLHRVYFGADY
jgi:hypothetical protein